jgi:two-component system sensor histidine kinase FlrB
MPKGGLISISAKKETDSTGLDESVESVGINIEDNGPGLDPKISKDIFKPFSTTKKDGSGLGLAIVKRLVEGLGGNVSGKNAARKGTRISIHLPVSIDKKVLNTR